MSDSARNLRPVFGPFNYLKIAEAAAAALDSAAVSVEDGIFWPSLPEADTSEENSSFSFYYGNAGKVFFLTQLYAATRNPAHLAAAKGGVQYILKKYGKKPNPAPFPSMERDLWSFYFGAAGIAFSLIEFLKVAPDDEVEAYARGLTEQIVQNARPTEDGVVWSGHPGIISDGSTVLFLLYAAEHYNEPCYRELAVKAGNAILARGIPTEAGLRFNGLNFPPRPDAPDVQMPNFELGTAGVAYVLARLYEACGEERFLNAAKAGAAHVQSLAVSQDGASLVPYRVPSAEPVFYLGFCHGPAGTGRLYHKLFLLTKEKQYQQFLERLVAGVELTGAPETHSNGYWHVFSQCCGTAGIVHFYLGLWKATGNARYLEIANRGGRHIIGAASVTDAPDMKWYQAFVRVEPGKITLNTGFSDGVAGIGHALLHLHLSNANRFEVIRLPDDPF